jgi:TolB-like protein/Flp pilus assembly protein TadD
MTRNPDSKAELLGHTPSMGFWRELQRRRVYRMAGFYVVGAWLVIQVADVFFPAWGLPETALRFLIVATILCFPIALVFSWAFDITTSGIVKTEPADLGEIFDNSLKRTDYVVLAALLSIGVVIVFASLQKIVEEVDDALAAAEKIDNSVAVLPFANLDSNPDTGYFSDGVTEEILHRLSSLKALHILSRTSSFAFRDSNEGPARISEILGVRYLLQGSVRRDNNFVRVTASLIDDTGYQVWSETFDRKLEGIFAIQSEIANTVARHIEREIIPLAELPTGRTTTNMEAFDAYLVGRSFVNTRTPGWGDKAIAAFEEAIRLDENYAPPYAGLAVALSINNPDWNEARESIVQAAKTAIELDPELAEGHAALGLTLLNQAVLPDGDTQNQLERAERSLRRALELDPSLSIAHSWLSNALLEQGRTEEGNAVLEEGLRIDPLNPVLSFNVALLLRSRGENERAEQLLLRLTYLPEPPWMAYTGLIRQYFESGNLDKAAHWAKQGARASKGSEISISSALLAGCYERLGLTADADYWVADAVARSPQPVVRFFFKASQYRIRGDQAGLREEIEKLDTALDSDMDQLQRFDLGLYASANILAGNFAVGIDVFEDRFDFESASLGTDITAYGNLEFFNTLAYAYQQVGRVDEANALLTRLHEQLNVLVVEQEMNSGNLHHLRAQNFGLRGDFDAAADALEAAIKVGWLRYIWVMGNPTWKETVAYPRIARMLDDVKVELERQRAVVEHADAEHDFRAELVAARSALGR